MGKSKFKVGDIVKVKIIGIDAERQKAQLSMKI